MAQLQTDANNVEQLAKPWLWSVVPRQHTRAQPACAIKSQAGWARVRSHVARPGRVKALRGVTCSRQSLSCHCWNAYSRTKNCSSQGVTTCLAVCAGKLIFGIQTRWIWLVALCRLDKAVLQNWHLFHFFFILYIWCFRLLQIKSVLFQNSSKSANRKASCWESFSACI